MGRAREPFVSQARQGQWACASRFFFFFFEALTALQLLSEVAFGAVPMVQKARCSVKVAFVRDALVVVHVSNGDVRLALLLACVGVDAPLLREWETIHRVCKRALFALVRGAEQVLVRLCAALCVRSIEMMSKNSTLYRIVTMTTQPIG